MENIGKERTRSIELIFIKIQRKRNHSTIKLMTLKIYQPITIFFLKSF